MSKITVSFKERADKTRTSELWCDFNFDPIKPFDRDCALRCADRFAYDMMKQGYKVEMFESLPFNWSIK